jgi:APA family basic amino acid/polyamine antiporter
MDEAPAVKQADSPGTARLLRSLGLGDAMLLGLGSILGTGVFVSLALAAGAAGVWALPAILLAAAAAACNGLSSAALAAEHPVSGGTYEFGLRWLGPWAGFSAGWLFLLAKSASAASAALGCAGYLLALLGIAPDWQHTAAAVITLLALCLVLGGVKRSATVNAAGVGLTCVALLAFCGVLLPRGIAHGELEPSVWTGPVPWRRLAEAAALVFVAFTGYGRVATLGEEVHDPRRTIPRAIVATLLASTLIYLAVGAVGIALDGAEAFAAAGQQGSTPLAGLAHAFGPPWLVVLLACGAVSAMFGVLLNLLLGLSRVALAMARQGDLPPALAIVDAQGRAPVWAVVCCAVPVALCALWGNLRLSWSFSAFTVLAYYAITNAAALRLPAADRLLHPAVAWIGLLLCLALAVCIEAQVMLAGLGLLAVGWGWRWGFRRLAGTDRAAGA